MKKQTLFPIILSLFMLANFACKKAVSIENQSKISAELLSEDSAFVNLVVNNYSLLEYMYLNSKEQKNDLSAINASLNQMSQSKLSYDNQMLEIDKLLKFNLSSKLGSYMATFKTSWKTISSTYETITPQMMEQEYGQVVAKLNTQVRLYDYRFFDKNDDTINQLVVADCGWRYSLCIVAGGAAAVLCHAGCDTTALATTAGLGIPACVALCLTVQLAVSADCYADYCN